MNMESTLMVKLMFTTPPRTLENHVKQTVALAAGPPGMDVDVVGDHKEKNVDRKLSTDDKKIITTSGDTILSIAKTEVKVEKLDDREFPPPKMLKLLNLAVSDEYKLPETMVNFKGTIRNGKGNCTFLHNYFGLTLWKKSKR